MFLQLHDSSPFVKQWQQFLKAQGFFSKEPDGNFDTETDDATRAFQQKHDLDVDGIAGKNTLGKAKELGLKMTVPKAQIEDAKQMLQWIKTNLGDAIRQAIAGSDFSEDWLAAICARETGFLLKRLANQGLSFTEISEKMKGDFSQRQKDDAKVFHGFGFWQIDVDSFGAFVKAGKWKDPNATAKFSVAILNDKKRFLKSKGWDKKLSPEMFERAVTAAYNCGEGNVDKALNGNQDVDSFTANKDYSKDVFHYREIYKTL